MATHIVEHFAAHELLQRLVERLAVLDVERHSVVVLLAFAHRLAASETQHLVGHAAAKQVLDKRGLRAALQTLLQPVAHHVEELLRVLLHAHVDGRALPRSIQRKKQINDRKSLVASGKTETIFVR